MHRRLWLLGGVAAVGCSARPVAVPGAHLPRPAAAMDVVTAQALGPAVPPLPPPPGENKPAAVPPALPGSDLPSPMPPEIAPGTPKAEREAAVRKVYPQLPPMPPREELAGPAMSLADYQEMAVQHSPAVRRAEADAQAAYGAVVQAGLHPNPTVGYQVDQWQPNLQPPTGSTGSGKGQQGGFVNQLIKTAGKLKYAQRVAGFDYVNALVAVRRARVDAAQQVRQHYLAALVAQKGVELNTALADLSADLYRQQLAQAGAGQVAGYEPLQLYAQAAQARAAVAQSQANLKAARRQLAAAVGRPDLPPAPLAGRADADPPAFDEAAAQAVILADHTDLLTARNNLEQAKANLDLQKAARIPDVSTNQVHQYDNLAQVYQLGVQVAVQVPLTDRNQGRIGQARGQIASAGEALRVTETTLAGRLAEALGRYEANRVATANFRDQVVPNLTRAYKAMVARHQADPDKVTFDDLTGVQQNLATALQAYLAALSAQWTAVADLAALTQQDELILPK